MNLAEKLAALQEAFQSKAAVSEKNAELIAKLSALEASLKAKDGEIAAAVAKVSELEAKLTAAAAEQEAAAKAIDELTKKQASAGEQAAKIAASVGVVPVETLPAAAEQPKTDEEIVEQYAKLQGAEKSAFYAKHRDAILRKAGL